MNIDEEAYLQHIGTPRHSGRYPWGSGGNVAVQKHKSFLDMVTDLRRQGLKDTEIVDGLGLQSTTQLRAKYSIARNEVKQGEISFAQRLKDKGVSNGAIGERMGHGESYVRTLLEPGAKDRADILKNVSDKLRTRVNESTYLDVGSAVESHFNISKEKLATAVAMLKEEGYQTHIVPMPQLGTDFDTKMKILVPPGVTQREAFLNRDKIQQVWDFSNDGGRTFPKVHDPLSINPNRVSVRYKEDGGGKADGVIYVRPGVKDIAMGKNLYAQVRVQVGDGHYLKGMARYKEDLPTGTDLVFNTNKTSTGNKLDAMKEMVKGPLPFGAVTRPIIEDIGGPNERVTSVMNIVNEEGDWKTWSQNLSPQFLSKQSPTLATSQLAKTYDSRKKDIEEIINLTNPTIKKYLLDKAADAVDSASVHLKAASMPKQIWHSILPIDSISPKEIYAPNYNNGERVVLIRYPHGGKFEIPELTVNNRNREASRILPGVEDVVGIHHSVAQTLSGADFDGDTVLVIPNPSRKIQSDKPLDGLKSFDPIAEYPAYEGMVPISKRKMQQEMGNVSNLITDMTIKGAPHSDLVRAIRHSMVVIDSEKKNLNYKESARQNGIAKLKQEYQDRARGGAATLLSRAGSEKRIPERKARPAALGGPVDKLTGRKEFVDSGKTRLNKAGERVPKLKKYEKLALVTDAHELSSGTRMETIYADHSNKLKALANEARLVSVNTPSLKYSKSAKTVYKNEVESLNAKLNLAIMNRPRERQAQVIASAVIKAKRDENPNLDDEIFKKIKFSELEKARIRMGAKKKDVEVTITPNEWDAIQAGAISNHKLQEILTNTDLKVIRQLATPRRVHLMTPNKTSRARAMLDNGATRAEVARILGVSLTTLDTATNG